MTIKELQKEKIVSRKENPVRSAALGVLLDAASKIAKEENREATDSDIVTAAKRNIKALSKTVDELGSGELVDKYKAEISVCEEFLPQMVSEAAIQDKINDVVSALSESERNMKSMGRVMGAIKAEFGDTADMSAVSRLVKGALS